MALPSSHPMGNRTPVFLTKAAIPSVVSSSERPYTSIFPACLSARACSLGNSFSQGLQYVAQKSKTSTLPFAVSVDSALCPTIGGRENAGAWTPTMACLSLAPDDPPLPMPAAPPHEAVRSNKGTGPPWRRNARIYDRRAYLGLASYACENPPRAARTSSRALSKRGCP